MTRLRIALVTDEDRSRLTPSDRVLAAALEARGHAADPVVWTRSDAEWGAYDLVVVRSPWDYFLRYDEFLAWVDRLEQAGVPLMNPPAVLRWNSHKRYLRELEVRGARVAPSLWIDRGTEPEIDAPAIERGWRRVVVKPAVSGGAHDTWIAQLPLGAPERERLAEMAARGDVLVQPFIEVVATQGELSLMFVEGEFTHAVRKRVAAGDFRVQEEHGGSFEAEAVSAALVSEARQILAMAPAPTLYGRVDAVLSGGELLLMELEVVEPDLFLTTAPHAADRLAAAIERRASAPAPSGAP